MRYSVGCAAAALVTAACGFETDATHGHVAASGDVLCVKCIVTGDGQTDPGSAWHVSAMPTAWPAAAPGAGGRGIAATGFLRVDGSSLDWAIDTILHCTRDPGRDGALVSGTSPDGVRFFAKASEGSSTVAVYPDRSTLASGRAWAAFVLDATSPGAGLHVDKLDGCEPCPQGECMSSATGRCEPCDPAAPAVSRPPPSEPPPPPLVPM
jgi:hypothetical protein